MRALTFGGSTAGPATASGVGRQGPNPITDNQTLNDSSGVIADGGAPDYLFAGLVPDEIGYNGGPQPAGTFVGGAYAWDDVALRGRGDIRYPPNQILRDSGWALTSGQTVRGLDTQRCRSFAADITFAGTGGDAISRDGTTGGLAIYVAATTQLRLRVYSDTGSIGNITVGSHTAGDRYEVYGTVVSGTFTARVWRNGTEVTGLTATGVVAPVVSKAAFGGTGFAGRVDSLKVSSVGMTASELGDARNGIISPDWDVLSVAGVRTGIHDPTDLTRLIWATGTGNFTLTKDT